VSIEVKICGLTNRDDAQAALDLGADYLGFVLYTKSPRAVSVEGLREILARLPAGVRAVGVFVNERRGTVEAVARTCGLQAVQIHGDEERVEDFAGFPLKVWRAIRHESTGWIPSPDGWAAERFLVDAAPPGRYGGAGKTADWQEAARLARRLPIMLAGGLTPDNVADAVRAVNPLGVDVVSGTESEPGRKDRAKMKRFIDAARQAAG